MCLDIVVATAPTPDEVANLKAALSGVLAPGEARVTTKPLPGAFPVLRLAGATGVGGWRAPYTAADLVEGSEAVKHFRRLVNRAVNTAGRRAAEYAARPGMFYEDVFGVPAERVLWIDTETYSSRDLGPKERCGPYAYQEAPDFQVLLWAWAFGDSPVKVAEEPSAAVLRALEDPSVIKVAHNAQFDRVVISRYLGLPTGSYLPPEEWFDTAMLAREWGYAPSLKAFALAVGAEEKDEAGTDLINWFSKPNRRGLRNLPEDAPEKWSAFKQYAGQDVDTMRDATKRLGLLMPWREQELYVIDQHTNDRGVPLLKRAALAGVEAFARNQARGMDRLRAFTGLDNPGSVQQFRGWLSGLGVETDSLDKSHVEDLLALDDLPDKAREALAMRQEISGTAASKYRAALNTLSDDHRTRGSFLFHGAHTGRWSGKGLQLHNLPSATFEDEGIEDDDARKARMIADTDAALERLLAGEDVTGFELQALIRPLLRGPFAIADYSAIEARTVAWLAGEQWVLDSFISGKDIYVETAERLGGEAAGFNRKKGKVAVLACGYGGGQNAIYNMGGKGFTVEERWEIVKAWRAANPRIVSFWQMLEDAVQWGGGCGPFVDVEKDGKDRIIWLPSGRPLVYRNTAFERFWVDDPLEQSGKKMKMAIRFDSSQGGGSRKPTFSGKLTENLVQAVARDVLAESVLRLGRRGKYPALHVHDEIVMFEEDCSVEELSSTMSIVPSWAPGLPLAAPGDSFPFYTK